MSAEQRRRPAVFFDTNILLYLVGSDLRKASVGEDALASDTYECVVSTQVVGEFINVSVKKSRLSRADIRRQVSRFRLLCRVDQITDDIQDEAMRLSEAHGFQWYDSLIVASAIASGAQTLLSEDLQHGRIVSGVTIVNPFQKE